MGQKAFGKPVKKLRKPKEMSKKDMPDPVYSQPYKFNHVRGRMGPHRKKGKKGWLDEVLNEGKAENLKPVRPNKWTMKHRREQDAAFRRKIGKRGINSKELRKLDRLSYLSNLISRGYGSQKVIYFACKKFMIGREAVVKMLHEIREEYKTKFSAENRALLLGDHCETLKHNARMAVDRNQFIAAEKMLRQYAEVIGLLVPRELVNVYQQDYRQQVILADPKMQELTLQKMEAMSAHDLAQVLLPDVADRIPDDRKLIETDGNQSSGEPESEGEAGLSGREEKS
jgi:hypothetical protein